MQKPIGFPLYLKRRMDARFVIYVCVNSDRTFLEVIQLSDTDGTSYSITTDRYSGEQIDISSADVISPEEFQVALSTALEVMEKRVSVSAL